MGEGNLAYTYRARIVRVVDGDSVYADIDLGFRMTARLPLRVRDLDTPEIYRPSSEEERVAGMMAKREAQNLLEGRPVTVTTFPDPGIYGRWTADITLWPDGRDYAQVMRESGFDTGEKA
jgi:micrococcal nuclease